MKRVLVAVAACAALGVGLFGPIAAVAGLDRGGNVLYEDGESGYSGWATPALAVLLGIVAWRQSEKRTEERMEAREEINKLKIQLSEQKDLVSVYEKRAEEDKRLFLMVDRYLNGELSEVEFFEAVDPIWFEINQRYNNG